MYGLVFRMEESHKWKLDQMFSLPFTSKPASRQYNVYKLDKEMNYLTQYTDKDNGT